MSVRLPAMVHQDGFMTSHTAQGVHTMTDEQGLILSVNSNDNDMLDLDHPVTHGFKLKKIGTLSIKRVNNTL